MQRWGRAVGCWHGSSSFLQTPAALPRAGPCGDTNLEGELLNLSVILEFPITAIALGAGCILDISSSDRC